MLGSAQERNYILHSVSPLIHAINGAKPPKGAVFYHDDITLQEGVLDPINGRSLLGVTQLKRFDNVFMDNRRLLAKPHQVAAALRGANGRRIVATQLEPHKHLARQGGLGDFLPFTPLWLTQPQRGQKRCLALPLQVFLCHYFLPWLSGHDVPRFTTCVRVLNHYLISCN